MVSIKSALSHLTPGICKNPDFPELGSSVEVLSSQTMSHSHCGDESHEHDHNGHSHSHSPPPDSIPGDSLYSKVDIDRVRCLNERVEGMARSVIKPWDQRLDTEKVTSISYFAYNISLKVMQMNRSLSLFRILVLCRIYSRFTGQVKLKSILLRTPPDSTAPKTVKM